MDPDLETILGVCEALYAPSSVQNFSEQLLAALKPVIPSTYYSWEVLSRAEIASISALCQDDQGSLDISRVMPAYQAYARQHPFAGAAMSGPQASVCTRSDLLPDRRWERTDFYNLVLQPLGVRDQLTLTFHGENAIAALVFHQDRAISERSRRVLHLLAPHIRQAMNASFRWEEAERAGASALQHGRVLLGFDGKVEEMEPGARALLGHHFPRETVSDAALPAAVRRWFDGAVRAMWSASEPAAMREARLATPAGELRLTLLTQFATRRHVILLATPKSRLPGVEERSEPAIAALTPREREVLSWIAEGKRNAEIALILGSAPATVKSQVESILRKLGAETRGAAAAMWRG